MKTLILNGSPRKNGDTISLVNLIIPEIIGDYRIVNAYDIHEVVFSHNTNDRPAACDEKALEGVKQIIQFFYGVKWFGQQLKIL